MSVTLLESDDVAQKMRAYLNCAGGIEALAIAVASDCVRNAVSLEHTSGMAANALGNRLRDSLRAVVPRFLSEERSVRRWKTADSYTPVLLRALYCIGDIHEFGNRYFPLAHKFINVDKAFPVVLIVGTTPTTILESELGASILTSGVMRIVMRDALPRRTLTRHRWQAIDGWLGVEEHDLKRWALAVLSQPRQWENDEPLGADNPEAYLPDLFEKRWVPASSLKEAPSGIRLCRWYSATTRTRHYCLALLTAHAGQIRMSRHSLLPAKRTGIRLMYGIDAMVDRPYQFTATIDGDEFEIQNPREMPDPENKLLQYLGTRKLKRRWTVAFPLCMTEFVRRALRLCSGSDLIITSGVEKDVDS